MKIRYKGTDPYGRFVMGVKSFPNEKAADEWVWKFAQDYEDASVSKVD